MNQDSSSTKSEKILSRCQCVELSKLTERLNDACGFGPNRDNEKYEALKETLDIQRKISEENMKEHNFVSIKNLRNEWKFLQAAAELDIKIKNKDHKHYETIDYIECLIRLAKFDSAEKILKKMDNVNSEVNYLRALVYRKQFRYEEAEKFINKAIMLPGGTAELRNKIEIESEIIKKFKNKKHENYNVKFEKAYYDARHSDTFKNAPMMMIDVVDNPGSRKNPIENIDQTKFINNKQENRYNILSIDGGGIRGIIPAIWLSEIERRSHRPISHLFNMIAGTSTGAIIAAALSAPLTNNKNEIRPLKSADDVTKIYLNDRNQIFSYNLPSFGPIDRVVQPIYKLFQPPRWTLLNLIHQSLIAPIGRVYEFFYHKYSDSGRKGIFEKYFNTTEEANKEPYKRKIKDSLTDLVIPACHECNLISNHLFNRCDALKNDIHNDSYVDVLMASTAAPTYFEPYDIESKGKFTDSGVLANNPSFFACSEAKRYGKSKNDMYVLSLGTGTLPMCTPYPTRSKGELFWGKQLLDILLYYEDENADQIMYYNLGKSNYERWQVFFEHSISLDAIEESEIMKLKDTAYQYIEEKSDAIDDTVKRLENEPIV